MLNVATPEALRVPVPSVVAPSLNVTVPDGMPPIGGMALTVAVKVTDWPNTDGLTDDTTAVVVLVFTVCVRADEVLVAWLALPP